MKYEELLSYLDRTTKPRMAPVPEKKDNGRTLSKYKIEKYRQKLNDENYMKNAIDEIIDKIADKVWEVC